ncbi:MAG TPA: DMT family transporter [Burkholderiales bacterium]|nr:DMT family transporter [Burkholderiales bacterium]
MTTDRKSLDPLAFGLMTVLCMSWGFQQVTIKWAAPDISLVMQAGLRSVMATGLLLVWARLRGIPLFARDGTLGAGLAAGAMFALEFVFIYAGLAYTGASRMVVFIYTTPCMTALMLPLFVKSERLTPRQWAGVLLAFSGIVAAFGEGFASAGAETFLGDLFGVFAAFLWASTIVLIRATPLARASATKTLFYQLAVSALVLVAVSIAMGEPGVVRVTPLAVAVMAYQGALVAFASYLAWFWLLTKYYAARLSVLTFMTPLFGVAAGVIFLGERLTPAFLAAALLVAAGIVLVNLPQRAAAGR